MFNDISHVGVRNLVECRDLESIRILLQGTSMAAKEKAGADGHWFLPVSGLCAFGRIS